MKIETETKFNTKQIVYWLTNGKIIKCLITQVNVMYNSNASFQAISYIVCKWNEDYNDFCYSDTAKVNESEIHTAEELQKMVSNVLSM